MPYQRALAYRRGYEPGTSRLPDHCSTHHWAIAPPWYAMETSHQASLARECPRVRWGCRPNPAICTAFLRSSTNVLHPSHEHIPPFTCKNPSSELKTPVEVPCNLPCDVLRLCQAKRIRYCLYVALPLFGKVFSFPYVFIGGATIVSLEIIHWYLGTLVKQTSFLDASDINKTGSRS